MSRNICTFCVYAAYPLAHQPMILHLFIYSCVGPCRFSQSVHLNISMKAHQIPTSWKKMVRPRPRHWDQTSPVAERWWEHIPEPHVSACLSPLGICSQFWPSRTSRTRNQIQDVIAQMILGRRSVGLLGLDWKGVQLSFCLTLVDTLEPLNLWVTAHWKGMQSFLLFAWVVGSIPTSKERGRNEVRCRETFIRQWSRGVEVSAATPRVVAKLCGMMKQQFIGLLGGVGGSSYLFLVRRHKSSVCCLWPCF